MTERRKTIVVVGMHRSGTSALTRIINLLGADLAGDLIPAGVGNERGHWESRAAQQLHNAMLADSGSDVYSPVNFRDSWFTGQSAGGFISRIAKQISKDYPDSKLFIVKDPRAALFIPLWLAALHQLSIQPHFVIPFRHPLAVAASLASREPLLDQYSALPIPHGVAMWLRYVLAAEKHTRGQSRSFVSFEMLLSNWRRELVRIGCQLGITWPHLGDADAEIDCFLDIRHQTPAACSGYDGSIGATVESIYRSLVRAVENPQLSSEDFDAAAERVSAAEEILGVYALGKEQQAATLRELLDANARQNASETESAHQAFEREIKARDARLGEATAYAKSQEMRANQLDESLAEARRHVAGLEQIRDEALRYAKLQQSGGPNRRNFGKTSS